MARTEITSRGIIIKNGQILLIHRRKNGQEYFVFPGGGIEDTETPVSAVEREVYEETGLSLVNVGESFTITDINGKLVHLFYLQVGDGIPTLTGEEKEISCEEDWYNPEWFDISILQNDKVYPIEARLRLLEDINKQQKTSPKGG